MTSITYDQIPSGLSDDCFEEALIAISQIDDDMYYQNAYNKCINNPKVYDDDGNFIPYSTVISTIEDHQALCSSRKINTNVILAKKDYEQEK